MSGAGFIMRFVDVVLILLFGFISIAEIKQSEIELPKSTEIPQMPMDTEEVVFVGVRADGTFLVDEETREIRSYAALRAYLVEQRDRFAGVPVKVKLRCAFDAPVRYAMAAAQLCDQLGLRKALEVEIQEQ